MIKSDEALKLLSERLEIENYVINQFLIYGPCSYKNPKENAFFFLRDTQEQKKLPNNLLLLIEDESLEGISPNFIRVKNCRLAFAIILESFNKPELIDSICESSIIHPSTKMPKKCSIGSFVKIEKGCEIGEGTIIQDHTHIGKNCKIGPGVFIKSGAKIGIQGFGFERDDDNIPVRIWHQGGVILGENVEVGANTIVCSGTILPTEIKKNSKLDDNVHLTHNCKVGQRTMIAGCASIGGSVRIGDDVWIGPNTSIMNKIKIGDRANIVLGSRVMRDIAEDKVFMNSNKSL